MFAYPKLTTVTLPSVSDWYTNTNIIRDPPRALTTKRNDKVGETSYITELVDSSTDRACEGIKVYARGVNPMVAVSYDNNSSNAGIPSSITANVTQAKLPYRIMDQGAFRPPILGQYELFPLSRLPRLATNVLTKPGFVDFSKSKFLPTKFRMVKDLLNTYEVQANKTALVENPIVENYKMNDSINDKHINIEANSGIRPLDISNYTRENVDMYKGINENTIEAWADTNPSKNISMGLEGMDIDKNNYINDHIIEAWADTNPSKNISMNLEGIDIDKKRYINKHQTTTAKTNISIKNTQNMDNIYLDTSGNIQDLLQYETMAGINPGYTINGEIAEPEQERNLPVYNIQSQFSDSRVNKTILHENELKYKRNLPERNFTTNITKLESFTDSNSRDFSLKPSLNKGGSFENSGVKPKAMIYNQDIPTNYNTSRKDKLRNTVKSIGNRDYRTKIDTNLMENTRADSFISEKSKMREKINNMQFGRD